MNSTNYEKEKLLNENSRLWEEAMIKLAKSSSMEEWRYVNLCRELCIARNKILSG